MTCPECEGTGTADTGDGKCHRCYGSGEICDICGEATNEPGKNICDVCEKDQEHEDWYAKGDK